MTQYDPRTTEGDIYRRWIDAGCFTAHPDHTTRDGGGHDPYVIPMPPPNVTAVLHVGHGLNHTVQDVLIRWRRMVGDEVLWIPGTDHAGIATQNVVEKQLQAEGTSRGALGREAFLSRMVDFVTRTGGVILEQLRAIGASADWTRTAYTLSPELSAAVREAFVRLYEEDLIYRGHRVIHWCPRCLTSLSDEEAEHEEAPGHLWSIRYPVADDPLQGITVATTRPETLLGDVAVAVHPDDARYRHLVGRHLRLPIVGVAIPVVADAAVDASFGTGAVKVTPAHDPNDFEIGLRHKLPMPVVMSPSATMEEGAGAAGRVPRELKGMDRFAARERIVAMLQASGELVKIENHQHAVRHCYRCDTIVEPRLSDQWFVRMAPLAAPALEAVKSGKIKIVPDRWVAVYEHWLENIRDWNISRQLWWGHRVPVWYCDACGWTRALREDPTDCPTCHGKLRQDEDVLDTWFSSWLWPFSTLGWPAHTEDLKAFYPGDVLVTAPEIIFFWVARMVMAGMHFMGSIPFHTVYLHGTVRDMQHRKMSKSLGNGIDPLDVVSLYGADALRYQLVLGMGLGADVILDPKSLEKSFAGGRNFVTKLWNIGRFLLMNIGDKPVRSRAELRDDQLKLVDQWILTRRDVTIVKCDKALRELRLNEYIEIAREFVWNDLADRYLEEYKHRDDHEIASAVLVAMFDDALRLLHPVVPFITETLWERLPIQKETPFLMQAAWPRERHHVAPEADGHEYELVLAAAAESRKARAANQTPPEEERAKLEEVRALKQKQLQAVRQRLAGEFAVKAKPEVVEGARQQEKTLVAEIAQTTERIVALGGGSE